MGVVIPKNWEIVINVQKIYNVMDVRNQWIKKKEVSADLKELKRQPPNEFGHMLPKYIIT